MHDICGFLRASRSAYCSEYAGIDQIDDKSYNLFTCMAPIKIRFFIQSCIWCVVDDKKMISRHYPPGLDLTHFFKETVYRS